MGTNVYFLKKFSNANNYNAYAQSINFRRPNISIDDTTVHLSTPANKKIDISISDEQNLNNYTKAPCSLKKFKTLNEYTNYVNSQNFKRPNISYCIETERVYWKIDNEEFDLPLEPPTPEVGDILYSDNTTHELSFTSKVLEPSKGKTPIAICVAPKGFFGGIFDTNEKARWVSLKYMDSENPDNGSANIYYAASGDGTEYQAIKKSNSLYFGMYSYDIEAIPNIYYTMYSNTSFGYLSDINNNDNDTPKIPSLFTSNNKWNRIALGIPINKYAITDINGYDKTQKIIDFATDQEDWKTSEIIYNEEFEGGWGKYAPAACCCWRYHPQGTQQGDWYLPACGELAILAVQKDIINSKLAAINTVYPNDCVSSLFNGTYWNTYWTSTEYDNNYMYNINFNNGQVNYGWKYYTRVVIAFLQY